MAGVPACIVVLAGTDPRSRWVHGDAAGRGGGGALRGGAGGTFELSGCGDDWVELWFPAPVEDGHFSGKWDFCRAADAEGGVKSMESAEGRLMYLWWESESEKAEVADCAPKDDSRGTRPCWAAWPDAFSWFCSMPGGGPSCGSADRHFSNTISRAGLPRPSAGSRGATVTRRLRGAPDCCGGLTDRLVYDAANRPRS